ncbi:MAG: hypothetical protein ACI93P_002673 [bacterium]|jgi:hypothetical protein
MQNKAAALMIDKNQMFPKIYIVKCTEWMQQIIFYAWVEAALGIKIFSTA